MKSWGEISLWMEQLDEPRRVRPALDAPVQADVVIIGAGYTGLWAAYYLKRQAPHLRVVMLEAEVAGFGASGRNGGWLMGNLLGEDRMLAALAPQQRRQSFDLLHGIPDEVAQVVQREGIDCDLRKSGVLYCAARYPEQLHSLRQYLAHLRGLGLSEDDYRWLEPGELAGQVRMANAYGAVYSPHCATLNPARLVRGLARSVEALGVTIYEGSRVLDWQAGRVTTERGSVQADWVVPAVEGYAASLPPLGRHQLPVQSLMVATEPLPAAVWGEIGLAKGQAFSEFSRQVTYGQRTRDDRLVFGARGGYLFGGRLRTDFNLNDDERSVRHTLMGELFPALRKVRLTHAWGGNLGMARRFQPHMLRDSRNRIALAGGYGGEGVGASNLAGRTLADLILGRDSPLLQQPWVLADSAVASLRRWEPEPCRWLGYNAIIRSFASEDALLANPRTPAWRRRLARALADRMESLMSWKVG
ncbi:NAD(P)/FAD-dependent oxidoreductase [Pseudomonas sp.]|uniref:NAD(P)/FAD-dependent oxidoreductase n=1 Tax=Pseudomonas sp. TaxID=306 RepID=UPI003CC6AEBA